MTEAIIVALITGACSVIAVIITNNASNKRTENQLQTQQAIFQTKLDDLTREVRNHNNFAQRIPVLENEITNLKQQINNLKAHP